MPEVLEAIILGVVQGLTEFLPISSTGHLILAEKALGISGDDFGLRFDAAIHLGTLTAVLIYFRVLILSIIRGWFASIRARKWNLSRESTLAWLLLMGTIPAGIAGYLLESTAEDTFREPLLVGVMMLVFSLPMFLAERYGSRQRDLDSITPKDSLVMGAAQCLALIPGVSRSGITLSAGMLSGFKREEAAVFVFLLSAPVIAAAGGKQIFDVLTGDAGSSGLDNELLVYAAGLITAAVVGYLSVAFLLRYLRFNTLAIFIYYRLILGTIVIALAAAGVL
ncbi:MAG: undecaprenyl-diphosphatase UppP [Dehalococcoidia bacterium]